MWNANKHFWARMKDTPLVWCAQFVFHQCMYIKMIIFVIKIINWLSTLQLWNCSIEDIDIYYLSVSWFFFYTLCVHYAMLQPIWIVACMHYFCTIVLWTRVWIRLITAYVLYAGELWQNDSLALQFLCLSNALTLRVRTLDASKSQRVCVHYLLSQFTRKSKYTVINL